VRLSKRLETLDRGLVLCQAKTIVGDVAKMTFRWSSAVLERHKLRALFMRKVYESSYTADCDQLRVALSLSVGCLMLYVSRN